MINLSTRSAPKQLSQYDFYSTLRDVGLMILAFLIANTDMVADKLSLWGADPIVVAFVLYMLVELGRKFLKDYTK